MTQPWAMIRLSALGDALLATGVLDYWHKTRGLTFHVLTRPALAPVFAGNPAVERLTALLAKDMTLPGLFRLARRVSDETAGLLDLHGNLRSRFLGAFWNGPVRRYPKFGLERRLFLASHGRFFRERLESVNVAQRYALAFEKTPPAQACVRPVVYLQPEELSWAEARLSRRTRPLVALHPYATHANKAWPAAHWEALARMLGERGADWFVIGQNPHPLCLAGGMNFTNAATLRESAALLSQTDVLVTGDSGPMHLACAVKTPVVALFGPTAKAWGFMPAGERDQILQADLPCRPCSLHGNCKCPRELACMHEISPEAVCRAVFSVVER